MMQGIHILGASGSGTTTLGRALAARLRYGTRIIPGGDMYASSQAFLTWAASYDDGDLDVRSRRLHEQWLGTLPGPIVCFEGEYTIAKQIAVLEVEIHQ
jgi:ABC-type glutathione transport system ATPase component